MNTQRLLDRFLRYVQMDTMANAATDDYPSSRGQWELGRLLVSELREIGLGDAAQDVHGLVTATIPANVENVPVVALNAHLDTSPETSGNDIKPQVIHGYDGRDIVLPGDKTQVVRLSENPELAALKGCTLITSDGTTLLGADDKAGLAVIIETAAYLAENQDVPHGDVRILFTCDEEIGRGVDHVDIQKLAATVCYTLDGPGAGQVDVETFSADLATIVFRGQNIHPAIAKGRMVNSIRAAAEFVSRLPRDRMAPEVTAGREGFLHPYELSAAVGQTELHVLLRDFDNSQLGEQAQMLEQIAQQVQSQHAGCEIQIQIKPQYRNLGDGLAGEPRAVGYVEEAFRRLGRSVERTIIRGGTDGSRLTELGLPTPNLSTGQHNPHSKLEWACLDEMQQAGEVLVELLKVWAGT